MVYQNSPGRKAFILFNYLFLSLTSIICLFPVIHILALSFSSSTAASAGLVKLLPVDFSIKSYEFVMNKPEFSRSFLITLERVALGVPTNIILTILVAYPLSKSAKSFKSRNIYAWMFWFTMIFSAGLIPTYVVVSRTGIIDSIWAMILPGAIPVFNILLMMNFFRQIPPEIEESSFMDGAGHLRILISMFLPISLPSLATITLISFVTHWNSWFDGIIYMNSPSNYPLQSYLQTVVVSPSLFMTRMQSLTDAEMLSQISNRTSRAAQIFIAMVPVMLVYPFLQKYFMQGLVLGSVKG